MVIETCWSLTGTASSMRATTSEFSSSSLLDRSAVPFQAVLTKADKVGAQAREATLAQVRGALQAHPAAYPELLLTSSEKGDGIETLRAIIAGLV